MEIQKAKELRNQLNQDILSLIQNFEEDTETHVTYVNLDNVHMLKDTLPKTARVKVEFEF